MVSTHRQEAMSVWNQDIGAQAIGHVRHHFFLGRVRFGEVAHGGSLLSGMFSGSGHSEVGHSCRRLWLRLQDESSNGVHHPILDQDAGETSLRGLKGKHEDHHQTDQVGAAGTGDRASGSLR